MNTYHVATITAYQIKAELGGGFRGVIFNRETKERRQSDRLDTIEAAKFWAKSEAHKAYEPDGYSLAPIYRKGEYYANVWVRGDEA